jgi:hypothetical protein
MRFYGKPKSQLDSENGNGVKFSNFESVSEKMSSMVEERCDSEGGRSEMWVAGRPDS